MELDEPAIDRPALTPPGAPGTPAWVVHYVRASEALLRYQMEEGGRVSTRTGTEHFLQAALA